MVKPLLFIGAGALFLVASGCGSIGKATSRSEISHRQRAAISAALRAGGPWETARFPDSVGSRPCAVPVGGLSRRGIRGTCTTLVHLHADRSALVVIVEHWPKREFYGVSDGMSRFLAVPGKPWRRLPSCPHCNALSFTYQVRISPSGHATLARMYGDFPPQFVR